jgi:hypothetical protein
MRPNHFCHPNAVRMAAERFIVWLMDEPIEVGHEVTSFASADTKTRANLIWCSHRYARTAAFRKRFEDLAVTNAC